MFAAQTYHAAASMSMPTENPASVPIAELDGKKLSLTDTGLNRGMLAVVRHLREAGVSHPQAYVWQPPAPT
jgi:hypothetical protein